MFANVKRERERERERLLQACQSKHCISGSTRRERDVCVCSFSILSVCWLFYSGNSSTYFKLLCISLQKKSDRTRSLAVSILEYNNNWNSKSAERGKACWFSEGRTK